MKRVLFMMIACALLALDAFGQMIPRQDATWARRAPSAITLDGVMNETAWAQAESINVVYGQNAGLPGSGWKDESPTPRTPSDPTRATLKFLIFNDSLYIGIRVQDSSVGGGPFNAFDGFLMNLRYRQATGFQYSGGEGRTWNTHQSYEAFYAWIKESWGDPDADLPGRMPHFAGFHSNPTPGGPRPDTSKLVWDAATTVQGAQNVDATIDQGYTSEIKFNLRHKSYDVSQAAGEVIMFSISIYDADWRWPINLGRTYGNRTWVQCPWGSDANINHLRIHTNPNVTTTSGPVPTVAADLVIPGAGSYPSPNMDGRLTEAIWSNPGVGMLTLKYGDAATRNAYPTTARYRSGHFQPEVNGGRATIQDANTAVVKYFYKADTLFFGFDVQDLVVQSVASNARWDGFAVTVCQRNAVEDGAILLRRELAFRVGGAGTVITTVRESDLAAASGRWDSAATRVQVNMALKSGTSIDTVGATPDVGYTAEMRIRLDSLGYPAGGGDRIVFLSLKHFDGDSFTPITQSYGTHTWFMRQEAGRDGAAWAWMNPNVTLAVDEKGNQIPEVFTLVGNYPNPFNPSTTIRFILPQRSEVKLEVFNVLGQLVALKTLGEQQAGEQNIAFDAGNLATGLYNYRLTMATTNAMVAGKMMLVK